MALGTAQATRTSPSPVTSGSAIATWSLFDGADLVVLVGHADDAGAARPHTCAEMDKEPATLSCEERGASGGVAAVLTITGRRQESGYVEGVDLPIMLDTLVEIAGDRCST